MVKLLEIAFYNIKTLMISLIYTVAIFFSEWNLFER